MKSLNYISNSISRLTILLTLLIPGLGGLFLSCRCPHADSIAVPEDFKEYFHFPAGSYWVYKNQSGIVDTQTLKSYTSMYQNTGPESCDKMEEITITYLSSLKGSIRLSTEMHYGCFSLCEYPSDGHYFNDLTSFVKNTNNENEVAGCNYQVKWRIQDSVKISDSVYCNVYVDESLSNLGNYEDYPVLCYFGRSTGLLKRVLKNGEDWELVDLRLLNFPIWSSNDHKYPFKIRDSLCPPQTDHLCLF